MQKYLSIQPIFNECTIILDRATLEGEVFARLLDPRKNYQLNNKGKTAMNYWHTLYDYLNQAEQAKLRLPDQFHKAVKIKQAIDNMR